MTDRLRDFALDSCHHAGRRFRMAANRANVSLDHRYRESHARFSQVQRSASAGACCAGATALLIGSKTSDVSIGSTAVLTRRAGLIRSPESMEFSLRNVVVAVQAVG